MKSLTTSLTKSLAVLILLAGAPLLAQDRGTQITPWISQSSIEGEENFGEGFATDFSDSTGAGLSINRFFGRVLSVEASGFSLRNDASLIVDDATSIDLGSANLTVFSLGAQIHLPRSSRFDPYVGAGAAYVIAGQLTSNDLAAAGIGAVDLENAATYYLNAGIGVQISSGLAIVADARYLPFETDSRSTVTGVEQEMDLTTRLLSLGLRFRF